MSVIFFSKKHGPLVYPDGAALPPDMFDNHADYEAWLESQRPAPDLEESDTDAADGGGQLADI